MDKGKASLMGEQTLWQLYRRLLAATLLQQRLLANHASLRHRITSAAIAAALTENLLQGDALGLSASDLVTRYLFGVPLAAIRDAALVSPATRKRPPSAPSWLHALDQDHALLPAAGAQQANLATGVALGAQLLAGSSIVVLVQGGSPARRGTSSGSHATPLDAWAEAAHTALALQLPLLFVTESSAGLPQQKARPGQPAPSMPAIPVDRDDTVALYRVIYEAAARARAGGGPTWIDCRDARPLSPARHRRLLPDEGPLARLEQALRARKCFAREQQRHVQRALEREFAAAGWPLNQEP